jgi:hypothetical protein
MAGNRTVADWRWHLTVWPTLLLLAGCTGSAVTVGGALSPSTPDQAALSPAALHPAALYQAALEDAAIPLPAEVATDLVTLSRSGWPKLIWEGPGDSARIRVVSLMNEAAYQKYYAADPPNRTNGPAWGIVWVTAAPQLQEFCRSLPGDAAARLTRVKQWLGLRPDAAYDRVVELWIAPSDVVRPCPDREVADSQCSLDNGKAGEPVDEPGYAAWFTGNYRFSYRDGGYPWTRLGYTYDWAPASARSQPDRHVGASEFILRPGVSYTIASRSSFAAYCAPGS